MNKQRRTGGNGAAWQAAISLAFVVPAAAQPAPNARPLGGQVVAGSAAIATGATTTTITQSSNRAAIDWRSFDVGSGQSVIFNQPGASSVTLNRVTGPDPSAIAGRISANGQLVLTNPSGVVFHAGSQVNAQSVIVSAPGITNQNFMAGRMVFDQAASPNARIENAGAITVKQAGLAALVAPSVANSGTITARLGHVVLAGAAAHTLDMYGDGLVAIDITKQVTQAPVGPGGNAVTALVTNTGTIAADGGTIQLSARAADGVVNTLVQAGGRLHANTVGARIGQIEIAGTGGSVVIEGRVAVNGRSPGTAGGSVAVAGSDATIIAPAARVTANGRAGGGTVAIGTNLARARSSGPAPAGTSARTVVAAGARISADATANGDGGRVTVLSTQSTTMAGAVTARGGPSGGNGGTIELSGETGFRLTGTADTSAPHGALGTVVLDPRDLTITDTANGTTNQIPVGTNPNISATAGGTTADAYVTPAQIDALTGNILLQTTRDLVVASSLTYQNGAAGGANLTLQAGRNLTVNSGVTITVPGAAIQSAFVPGVLALSAGTSTIAGYDPAGTLTVLGNLQASGLVLNAGTGGIVLSGALSTKYYTGPTNFIDATSISTTGSVVQTAGSLVTESLSGSAASIALVAAGNQISTIGAAGSLTSTVGGVAITTSTPLTVTAGASSPGIATATGQTISLVADTLNLNPGGIGIPALSAPSGTVALQPLTNNIMNPRDIVLTSSTTKPTGVLALTTAETGLINASTLQFLGPTSSLTFGQSGDAPVDLIANGNFAQVLLDVGGSVGQSATTVRVNAVARSTTAPLPVNISLEQPTNTIPIVRNLASSNDVVVSTSGDMTVSGAISAQSALEFTAGNNLTIGANATVSGPAALFATAGNVNQAGTLTLAGTVSVTNGGYLLAGSGGVQLSGAISLGSTINVSTTGPLTQVAGSLSGGTLVGNTGPVSLPSRGNALGGVSGLSVIAGDLLLVNSIPTTVSPPGESENSIGLTLFAGHTATLVTDYLRITNGGVPNGTGISATGGAVVVAPYTAGGAVLLTSGAKPSTGLSLTTSELALVTTSSLQLGGTGGLPVAGAITVGQAGDAAIDLGALGISRLTLSASGAVTQTTALAVTTLAGTAGSLALANAGNYITELNGLATTAGDLALHTSSGLTVSGAVSASGNVTLSSETAVMGQGDVALSLAAGVSGAVVRFDTTDGSGIAHGIDQTAGIVTAGTLTGLASTLNLPQANQITALGDFTTQGTLSLTNGRALAVTGTVTSSGAVTLNAQGITQTAASSLTAPELDGSSTADTMLGSGLNAVSTMGSFNQSGGSFTLVTSVPELDFGGGTGQVSAATGSLTFVADRVGLLAQPAAGTSVSANAGLIAFAPFTPSRPIVVVGTVAPGPNVLALSTNFLTHIHADTLALGRAGSAGPITFRGANESLDLSAFHAIQLQTTGAVSQGPGSVLTVSSLNGTAGSIVLPGNNDLSALGLGTGGAPVGLAATAGALTVGSIANLTLYGPVSSTTAITLSVGGALSEATTSSQISADTLTISAASVSLIGTNNRIGTLHSAVTGDLTLSGANGLTIAGGSTIGGTLSLDVVGAITGGPVTANALTGSATSLTLTAANQIGSLGPFTSASGFSLVDAASLTVTGAVSDPTAIALNVTGDLTVAGSLSSAQVTLNATGTITQTGGTITAGTLTGNAAGSAILGQAGNNVATLGGFTTGADFTLVDGRSLVVSGPVDPNTVTLTVQGDLTLNSSVTGGIVVLDVSGAILEGPGGRIVADTLTGRAGSAALNGGNQIATLGGIATSTGFSLANSGALTIAGPVTDGRSIAVATSGPLTLAGDISAPAVSFSAAGALTQSGGAFTAGTLSGSADSIDLGRAGSAAIGQIAGLAATGSSPGTLSVVDTMPLRISGTLSGRFVSITAAGSLVLADGTVIRTDGQPASAQLGRTAASPGSNLVVSPGADGRATLTQAGTVTIAPLGAPVASLRIDLPPSGGTIALSNLQAGGADLVLDLGSGAATGRLVARNLTVLGAGGQATLSGTIGGLSGDQAAQTSELLPGFDLHYTLNGCAISLASCSLTAGVDVPSIFQPEASIGSLIASAISSVIRPDILALDVLDLSVTRDRDDPTLLLPNISDKDY